MRMALRGQRNLDSGVEQVTNDTERRALRLRARRVFLLGNLSGLVLAGLLAALP